MNLSNIDIMVKEKEEEGRWNGKRRQSLSLDRNRGTQYALNLHSTNT